MHHIARGWPIAVLLFSTSFASSAQQLNLPTKPSSAGMSEQESVTVTGMVPIPDVGPGAPRYTSADIKKIEDKAGDIEFKAASDYRRCFGQGPRMCDEHSLIGNLACEEEYARRSANLASKAAAATLEAEAVRREAAAGRATPAAVEAAEFKRQAAVNKMQAMRKKLADTRADIGVFQEKALNRGLGSLIRDGNGAQLFGDLELEVWADRVQRAKFENKPGAPPGLRIEGVRASAQNDKNGSLLVQGRVVNTSAKPVEVPGLVAMLIDERNWVVARKSVTPDKSFRVAGNSSRPFGFLVEAAPQATRRATVAFAHETEPPPRIGIGVLCPIKGALGG